MSNFSSFYTNEYARMNSNAAADWWQVNYGCVDASNNQTRHDIECVDGVDARQRAHVKAQALKNWFD